MQKEIIKIELVLENCEVIMIEGKYIGDFNIENIKRSISRMACNYIDDSHSCDSFTMSVHSDCSKNTKSEWTFGDIEGESRDPLKRINTFNDITSIYVYFSNNQENHIKIYVPWGGDSDYNNEYQHTYINKFGDLYIVIGRNITIENAFDVKEIEDESHRDFIWRMYS